jgi:hypothetical protein
MAALIKHTYIDDDMDIKVIVIHCTSFDNARTLCGIEYTTQRISDEISFDVVVGSIKKVTCPFCKGQINFIKSLK